MRLALIEVYFWVMISQNDDMFCKLYAYFVKVAAYHISLLETFWWTEIINYKLLIEQFNIIPASPHDIFR